MACVASPVADKQTNRLSCINPAPLADALLSREGCLIAEARNVRLRAAGYEISVANDTISAVPLVRRHLSTR